MRGMPRKRAGELPATRREAGAAVTSDTGKCGHKKNSDAADAPKLSWTFPVARIAPWRPSVLVWQGYAPFLARGGTITKAVEEIARGGFFRSIEITLPADPARRLEIARRAKEAGLEVMVWVSDLQASEQLSLAALDRAHRDRSAKRFREMLSAAAECGASRFGFCSPPDCDGARLEEAVDNLGAQLIALGREAAGIGLVFEALDHKAHKKGLLGTSTDLAKLAARVRAEIPSFGVAWDAAHAALNGEDLLTSYLNAAPHAVLVHLSEAVLDAMHPDFGDKHLPLTRGDVMTPRAVRSLLEFIQKEHRSDGSWLALTIEEMNTDPRISGDRFLHRAWSYVEHCL